MTSFYRRYFFIVACVSMVFVAIIARLFYLMVIQHDFYLDRSEKQIQKFKQFIENLQKSNQEDSEGDGESFNSTSLIVAMSYKQRRPSQTFHGLAALTLTRSM